MTMTNTKLSQVARVHFEHRLWKNELEAAQQETEFFQNILQELKTRTIHDTPNSLKVASFCKQFQHYERLIQRLLTEIQNIEKEIAESYSVGVFYGKEQKKDHQYLTEEMKYFEFDYRENKNTFKQFISEYEKSIS